MFCAVTYEKHFKKIWPRCSVHSLWSHKIINFLHFPQGSSLKVTFWLQNLKTLWSPDLLCSDISFRTLICSWKSNYSIYHDFSQTFCFLQSSLIGYCCVPGSPRKVCFSVGAWHMGSTWRQDGRPGEAPTRVGTITPVGEQAGEVDVPGEPASFPGVPITWNV